MGDIRSSLLKMDAAAKHAVHLYWFLPSPSDSGGNAELWPVLHGEPYCGEAGADVLWNALCQLGIYANVHVETKERNHRYASFEELRRDYYNRLSVAEDWQREIVDAFLLERRFRMGRVCCSGAFAVGAYLVGEVVEHLI